MHALGVRLFLRACFALLVLMVLTAACSQDEAVSVLEADDTKAVEGAPPFSKDNILDNASFADWQALNADQVEAFLGSGGKVSGTPYKRSSFLSTYQSNGARAVDSILNAARNHRINPLVFLVRMQAEQGLLGAKEYPFPTERVEYVFRCGCIGNRVCDPAYAGLDRQLECLGRALRDYMDTASVEEVTHGGWGTGKPARSLDNVTVTPENEATAALYESNPIVGEGSRGQWLFWNIWQRYIGVAGYSGAIGDPGITSGKWIGEACNSARTCSAVPDPICIAGTFPGGVCTTKCTGDCPPGGERTPAFCVRFVVSTGEAGYCMPTCNPGTPSCRPGYDCVSAAALDPVTPAQHVCLPQTGASTK